MHDRAVPCQTITKFLVISGRFEFGKRTAKFIDVSSPGTHQRDISIFLQKSNLSCEPLRVRNIIGVQHSNEFAPDFLKCQYSRRPELNVLPGAKISYARIAVALADRGTAVGRPVIPEDHFPILVGLRQYAVQCLAKIFLPVVAVHQDANEWLIRLHWLFP
jgi:hypothetical protein